jgi:hypothetical protein
LVVQGVEFIEGSQFAGKIHVYIFFSQFIYYIT